MVSCVKQCLRMRAERYCKIQIRVNVCKMRSDAVGSCHIKILISKSTQPNRIFCPMVPLICTVGILEVPSSTRFTASCRRQERCYSATSAGSRVEPLSRLLRQVQPLFDPCGYEAACLKSTPDCFSRKGW